MTWRRAAELGLIVLVFVAVGPLVGLPVFAAGMAAAASDWSDRLHLFAFFGIYGLVFAHFIGIVPALAAGLAVAAFAAWRGRVPLWWAVSAGGVGLLAFDGLEPLTALEDPNLRHAMQLTIPAVHVLPSIVCTRLTRRWQ